MTKEDSIYYELHGIAEQEVMRAGRMLGSRQIDAVIRAVARFLSQQPNISDPDILRAQKIADEMNRAGLAGGKS